MCVDPKMADTQVRLENRARLETGLESEAQRFCYGLYPMVRASMCHSRRSECLFAPRRKAPVAKPTVAAMAALVAPSPLSSSEDAGGVIIRDAPPLDVGLVVEEVEASGGGFVGRTRGVPHSVPPPLERML